MLSTGTKLGPYEILAPLGAGGMGEVYRARDTRLDRTVAIKVLPEAFAQDTERMARFRREAQVLASLNHPNIAAIYGFEDSGSVHALVMELVEGPTLADRIKSGAIPIDEALPIAKQICEAIEYAHERGIVHRDLKPANIKLAGNDKLSNNDAVKILDFGLAKALEGDPASVDISSSPTISRMATQAGIILGTAAYMSPEQAKGKSVDRRTDIWAFGCVLYEMLTGKMAFSGETVTDTLAAVIKSDPDWTELPAATPHTIRNLLQRCLKTDAKQRLQSIGDARIALEETLSGAPQEADVIKPPLQDTWYRTRRELMAWVLVAVLALLTIGVGARAWLAPRTANTPPAMAYIPPPSGTSFRPFGFGLGPVVVSPNGRELAFSAIDEKGVTKIWVRPLAGGEAMALAGTEDAAMPLVSGRAVAGLFCRRETQDDDCAERNPSSFGRLLVLQRRWGVEQGWRNPIHSSLQRINCHGTN
ncbi:MAG: protein kinase domain-containing protein [Candidatus Acidiferrales bacterium]